MLTRIVPPIRNVKRIIIPKEIPPDPKQKTNPLSSFIEDVMNGRYINEHDFEDHLSKFLDSDDTPEHPEHPEPSETKNSDSVDKPPDIIEPTESTNVVVRDLTESAQPKDQPEDQSEEPLSQLCEIPINLEGETNAKILDVNFRPPGPKCVIRRSSDDPKKNAIPKRCGPDIKLTPKRNATQIDQCVNMIIRLTEELRTLRNEVRHLKQFVSREMNAFEIKLYDEFATKALVNQTPTIHHQRNTNALADEFAQMKQIYDVKIANLESNIRKLRSK